MTRKRKNISKFTISDIYTYQGTEIPIHFRDSIGLASIGALVTQIVNSIIDEDGYYPYCYEYALYGNILNAFSDCKFKGIVELEALLKDSDVKEVMERNINHEEFLLICGSVDKTIEFQKQRFANHSEFDKFILYIREIIANLYEKHVKPLNSKTIENLILNLGNVQFDKKALIDALIEAKIIDQKVSEKTSSDEPKGEMINFAG